MADPGFHILLALLGHVILGILAQVAESRGLFDFFWEFVDEFMLERVNLVLQLSLDLLGHRCEIINRLSRIPFLHQSGGFWPSSRH